MTGGSNAAESAVHLLPHFDTRVEYMDYFDGHTADSVVGLTTGQLTHGLAKSYILETVGGEQRPDPRRLVQQAGFHLEPVDDDLFRLVRTNGATVGVVERVESRYPVLYTTLEARHSDQLVRQLVRSSPWLDHIWLAGRFFDRLWAWTQKVSPAHRMVRLKFRHEAFYESDGTPEDIEAKEPDEDNTAFGELEDDLFQETRKSVFTVTDRVDALGATLSSLRDTYSPLHSTVSLRIPSTGRGGHEIYDYGKVTNRSDSFAEHRQLIDFVTELYADLTAGAEESAWYRTETLDTESGFRIVGAPVYLKFSSPLASETLERWVTSTFPRKRNRFRLGGQPLWMGPGKTKVHVYGVDRHLWQPVAIEATTKHILAFLPRGTCGNTINRLITNVQQFLDPSVEAWVGDTPYQELVDAAVANRT